MRQSARLKFFTERNTQINTQITFPKGLPVCTGVQTECDTFIYYSSWKLIVKLSLLFWRDCWKLSLDTLACTEWFGSHWAEGCSIWRFYQNFRRSAWCLCIVAVVFEIMTHRKPAICLWLNSSSTNASYHEMNSTQQNACLTANIFDVLYFRRSISLKTFVKLRAILPSLTTMFWQGWISWWHSHIGRLKRRRW